MTTAVLPTKPQVPAAQPVPAQEKGPENAQAKPIASGQEETPKAVPETEIKSIAFEKTLGGKWKVRFTGKIQRRDINHLRRSMVVEWNRMKRDARIQARRDERKEKASG